MKQPVRKELYRAPRVSCMGWELLSTRDDSLAIILPSPTTSTVSSGHSSTLLAFFTSLFNLFLSAVEMLLLQKTAPQEMANATESVRHWMPGRAFGRIHPTTYVFLVDFISDHKQTTSTRCGCNHTGSLSDNTHISPKQSSTF